MITQEKIQYKENEIQDRLKYKNMICKKLKNIQRKEELITSRFVVNERSKLVGCLNNKVGSTTLTLAFLQLRLGYNVNCSHDTIWSNVDLVQPQNDSLLYNYLSEEGNFSINHHSKYVFGLIK